MGAQPVRDVTVPARNLFSRHLDTDGDGTGTKNANGNYSDAGSGLTQFYLAPAAGQVFAVTRLIVSWEDASGAIAGEYGNLGGALTNGIEVQLRRGASTVIIDLTDNVPVKTNAAWGRLCHDVDIKGWGAGTDLLTARWTFTNFGGVVYLDGAASDRLTVLLNDDMSGLVSHHFVAQGHVRGPGVKPYNVAPASIG